MLSSKTRPALEDLRSHLASWAMAVPARAERFHTLRADLEGQVSAALGRWLLRPGKDELSALRDQVDRLGKLAPTLAALIRQAEAMEGEVLDLRSIAERSADRELASWLAERCIDWHSALRRLGKNVGREAELEQDQATLERTQERVRRHAEAARRLEEARQLLTRLGNKVETAGLQADLPLLRQRLFAEGASAAWLAEMERAAAPVRAVVDLPSKAPPQTLRQVPSLLFEVRRWVRVLQAGEERVIDLQERYKIAEADWEQWTDGQIRGLLQEASQLLEDLRRTAAERRASILALLGARRLQLAGACGPNPELDRDLDALAAAGAAEPETYEEWMERQAEVHRRLLDAASARLVDLQERIVRLRRELREGLDDLERAPLPSRAASEAERLRLALEDLPDPHEQTVEAIFQSLETCDRIALDLERLAEQARADREALDAIRRRLLTRNQALREEVVRSGIEVSDLDPRIESLAAAGPEASLDDLHLEAEALELELHAREREFAARCASWIAGRLAALRGRLAVLRRAGRSVEDFPDPLADGLTPSQAASAAVAIRELDGELARQLDEVLRQLETRREEVRGRLERIPLRALRPEVRRDADDLSRWLAERSWESEADPEERARRLLDGLERCDTFLAKLSQDDREAQAKAEALRRRLRDFNEMDLDRCCPEELVQRVSALVAAIPAEPASWAEFADQLGAAEDLIGLLEAHARRVLAARLERAIPDLERQALATRDPAYARRLRALLDDMAARDGRQAVPAGLAAQILILATERSWEDGV